MKIPSENKIWRFPLLLKIKYFFKSLKSRDKACVTYWINANTYIWSPTIKHYNWGDYINLRFAELLSGKTIIPSRYHSFAPKVAMIGSILPWAMDKDTIVWGSGCLDSHDPLWQIFEKPKEVRAVRGPLTRKVLLQHGIDCPDVYGDPVLLFPRVYQPQILKTNKIGVIPHVSSISHLDELLPHQMLEDDDIEIINPKVYTTWHEFIDQIVSCKLVLSSSLHGVIVADAYNVPNVWVSFHVDEHPDGNFKFKDYYSSVGKDNITEPIDINTIEWSQINRYIASWKEPKIDLDKLYDVCPIKKEAEC